MKRSPIPFLILLLICLAQTAEACSVCFGDPDSLQAKGARAGVLLLLGVICVVLTGIAALIFKWSRRAKKLYS